MKYSSKYEVNWNILLIQIDGKQNLSIDIKVSFFSFFPVIRKWKEDILKLGYKLKLHIKTVDKLLLITFVLWRITPLKNLIPALILCNSSLNW